MTREVTVASAVPAKDQSTASTRPCSDGPTLPGTGAEPASTIPDTVMPAKLPSASQSVRQGVLGTITARPIVTWPTASNDVYAPQGCGTKWPMAAKHAQM